MSIRIAGAVCLALASAGCANEAPQVAGFMASAPLAIARPVTAGLPDQPRSTAAQPYRKTMSDRVLAAIALERVTGLKPDPARLVQ